MRKFALTFFAAAVMIGGGSLIGSAQAAPRYHQGYCWYDQGWNGAGWYQCGSANSSRLWSGRSHGLAWMGYTPLGNGRGRHHHKGGGGLLLVGGGDQKSCQAWACTTVGLGGGLWAV